MSSPRSPLSTLNRNPQQMSSPMQPQSPSQMKQSESMHHSHDKDMMYSGNGIGMLAVWFFILFVATWLGLFALKPSFVLKPGTNEVDTGKILLCSAVAAILAVILIWFIKGCTSGRKW